MVLHNMNKLPAAARAAQFINTQRRRRYEPPRRPGYPPSLAPGERTSRETDMSSGLPQQVRSYCASTRLPQLYCKAFTETLPLSAAVSACCVSGACSLTLLKRAPM